MKSKRSYPVEIFINGRWFFEVLIDSYYEEKHPDITDRVILKLVQKLHGSEISADDVKSGWYYYVLDQMKYEDKFYRLVWCIQEDQYFIGIINCFRR